YRRGSFTLDGVVTGFLLCLIITYSNISFMFVMLAFTLSGSYATKYKSDIKRLKISEGGKDQTTKTKKVARNYIQVLCNGSIAFLYSLFYCYETNLSGKTLPIDFHNYYWPSIYSIGLLFSIACCCGDTLASELGTVLCRTNPRLITNLFRRVPAGTNGGISLEGTLASIFGGFIVGLSFYLGNLVFCDMRQYADHIEPQWPIIPLCAVFGLLGSMIDSLLGATLQYSGYDNERKCSVLRPGGANVQKISGRNILSNNQVNIIASFLTSIVAVFTVPLLYKHFF
ncbi:unnamed protein product, partial [Didymodactylos carnosus]